MGKSIAFDIYESGLIQINIKNKEPVLIRSGILNPTPAAQFHLPTTFISTAVLGALVSGTLYTLNIFNIWMLSFCLLLIAALIGMQTTYQISYFSAGGNCQLFTLESWFIHRSQINQIADTINQHISQCELSTATLPQKIQEHRRLHDAGLISAPAYEQAKIQIFTKKQL